MRLLDVAGIAPITDDWRRGVSYEWAKANAILEGGPVDELVGASGCAVKILMPHLRPWPEDFRFSVIWIDRDPHQQSRSAAAFLSENGFPQTRREMRTLAAKYRRHYKTDRAIALSLFQDRPVLNLTFERLITDPGAEIDRLLAFTGMSITKRERMIAQVIRRSPRWSRSFTIETVLGGLAAVDNRPVWQLRKDKA